MSVELEFIGHACFRLWEDGKPTIVMDPYSEAQCKLANDGQLDADTVIVSSLTDAAHSNVAMVRGKPQVINALDVATGEATASINGQPLATIKAAEIPDHPRGPEDNALYAFTAGGLWFAHMGDLGIELSEEELATFHGKCDVLMTITGQRYTPKFPELDRILRLLKPTWIVPMHYGLPPLGGESIAACGMTPVGDFLEHRAQDPVLLVRATKVAFPQPKSTNGRPAIVVLEPAGYKPTSGLPQFCCS
jgi:L-ascorbate metabolism protein UlaG (beta-lactamase superfamily)